MRLSELENEFEHFRTTKEIKLITLRDENEALKSKLDSFNDQQRLVTQLKEKEYELAEREAEIQQM